MARKKDRNTDSDGTLPIPGGDQFDPIPEPVLTEPPIPMETKPVVPLAVFLRVAGAKWDQLAGFKQHARSRQLGPMSIPEWRAALHEFMNKPV